MSEWISIEEKFPISSTDNLILVKDGVIQTIYLVYYYYDGGFTIQLPFGEVFLDDYFRHKGIEITHWMPLPELPKDEV